MSMIYNLEDTPLTCLATSSHAVIHASLYLTEIVNAGLTDKSLTDPEEPTPSKLNKLANVAKDIASKFSTLNQDAHCILELTKMGLVCVVLWFYRIHNCFCSFSRCHIHERWMNGDRGNEDTTILQIQVEKKLQNAKINASGKML